MTLIAIEIWGSHPVLSIRGSCFAGLLDIGIVGNKLCRLTVCWGWRPSDDWRYRLVFPISGTLPIDHVFAPDKQIKRALPALPISITTLPHRFQTHCSYSCLP
jgi:hypothetical protein